MCNALFLAGLESQPKVVDGNADDLALHHHRLLGLHHEEQFQGRAFARGPTVGAIHADATQGKIPHAGIVLIAIGRDHDCDQHVVPGMLPLFDHIAHAGMLERNGLGQGGQGIVLTKFPTSGWPETPVGAPRTGSQFSPDVSAGRTRPGALTRS